jgi:hypothetical protein
LTFEDHRVDWERLHGLIDGVERSFPSTVVYSSNSHYQTTLLFADRSLPVSLDALRSRQARLSPGLHGSAPLGHLTPAEYRKFRVGTDFPLVLTAGLLPPQVAAANRRNSA